MTEYNIDFNGKTYSVDWDEDDDVEIICPVDNVVIQVDTLTESITLRDAHGSLLDFTSIDFIEDLIDDMLLLTRDNPGTVKDQLTTGLGRQMYCDVAVGTLKFAVIVLDVWAHALWGRLDDLQEDEINAFVWMENTVHDLEDEGEVNG